MDKSAYIQEGERQLSNINFFEKVHEDPTGEVICRVNLHVHSLLEKGQITKDICKYLTTDIGRTQLFYMLPKIHKGLGNPLGRPTVSSSDRLMEKIS